MKKFLPTLVIASCALAIGLAAGSLAIARSAPDAIDEEFEDATAMAEFPVPVAGSDLFFGYGNDAVCLDRDQVISILLADQREFGGRTLAVAEDRFQSFSDNWRDEAGFAKVAVSGVLGHMFFDKSNEEWTVDVVEFDSYGCAMSRTLMPGTVWTELLESTAPATS